MACASIFSLSGFFSGGFFFKYIIIPKNVNMKCPWQFYKKTFIL